MLARVRPFNNYGGAPEGSLVEVPEAEVRRVPWCLESAEDPVDRGRKHERSEDVVKVAEPVVEPEAAPKSKKRR